MLISAHRFGAGRTGTWRTRSRARGVLTLGVDYVEFDVQRLNDGTFVVFHDDWVAVDDRRLPVMADPLSSRCSGIVVRYDDVLSRSTAGRAHIDLKFTSPDEAYADPEATYEVAAVRRALEVLGAG